MKKNSIVLLSVFLSFIFFSTFVIGYFYRVNLMEIELNKVGGHVLGKRQIAEVKNQKGKILPGIDKALLANPTDDLLSKGKKLFDVNCFSCHGLEGRGDGAAAVALNPKPRNFHVAEGWKNGHKVSDIFRTLTHGIMNSAMPGFDYMPPKDRLALAYYVRSFNGKLPKDSSTDLEKLDKEYGLTKGTIEPNTIPVERAEKLIVNEQMQMVEKAKHAAKILNTDNSKETAFFNTYVSNPEKVAAILFNSSDWEKSSGEFSRMVTADPIDKGFNSKINNAGTRELKALFSYAKQLKEKS